MKTLDLKDGPQDLGEVLRLAGDENLLLTTPDGRQFLVAEIDDFDEELRLVREQPELMALLEDRSAAGKTFPLDEVKRELGLT